MTIQSTENDEGLEVGFSLEEVTGILIKHQGLHEGLYNLSVKFALAFGAVGPEPEPTYPGAMIGVAGLALSQTEQKKVNKDTVDAAKINPSPELKAKVKTKIKTKAKPKPV